MTTRASHLLPLTFLLFLSVIFVGCDDNDKPTASTPVPRGTNWRVVQDPNFQASDQAASSSVLVALEENVGVRTTLDGETWIRVHLGYPHQFSGSILSCVNETFFTLGHDYRTDQADMRYSTDGIHWEKATVPYTHISEAIGTVTGNESIFIGFSSENKVYSSTNAATWELLDSLPDLSGQDTYYSSVVEAVWTGERFVAVTGGGLILSSQTGQDWQVLGRIGNLYYVYDFAFANGTFVAISSSVYVSHDGQNWQVAAYGDYESGEWYSVTWSPSVGFLVTGLNDRVLISADGNNWQLQPVNGTFPGYKIEWWHDRFIGAYTSLTESFNGIEWEYVGSSRNAPSLSSVTAGPWGFVAVGPGCALHSFDGNAWEPSLQDTTIHFASVTADRERYYAVSNNRYYYSEEAPGRASLYTSTTGMSWEETPLCENCYVERIQEVDGKLFALGLGILVSDDGRHWVQAKEIPIQTDFRCVASNGHTYVVVGSGVILSSPDGLHWTARTPENAQWAFAAVAWSGSEFVAVSTWGELLGSSDGIRWDKRHAFSGYGFQIADLIWDVDQFIAVGRYDVVLKGANMFEWANAYPEVRDAFAAVASNGHRLVAVGRNGAIIVSP